MNKAIRMGFSKNPSDQKYLVRQQVKSESQKKEVILPIHHTFIIDCSGSMYSELPKIRKDLYNKIATMLKPADSVSIIWFSGKGQFGTLLEDYQVNSAMSLSKVKETIDRYLTTQGLTAFKEPIVEMKALIERVQKRDSEMLHTMTFLTDGYDNCWSVKEILAAIESVKTLLASAAIVEYGYYCNKELLNQMASTVGGNHIFSDSFDSYEQQVVKTFTNGKSVKRRYVKLEDEPVGKVVFTISDGNVITYTPNENNEIFVAVDGQVDLFYISDNDNKYGLDNKNVRGYTLIELDGNENLMWQPILYAAAFVFSRKNNYTVVSEILRELGDAALIKQKMNSFGKQKLAELEARFLDCVSNKSARFVEGFDPFLEPAADAFCVFDMLDALMEDGNYWYPQHEAFGYKRIGKKAVAKSSKISDKDKQILLEFVEAGEIEKVQSVVQDLLAEKSNAVEFTFNEKMQPCPITELVWNESRMNLSVQVEYEGTVNLPENTYGIPLVFPTKIFRNYTLVKDGIIHTYQLPVALTEQTFVLLQKNGLLEGESYAQGNIYVLDFSKLPVLNQKMMETISAEELFTESYELLKLQAANTVYNAALKEAVGTGSKAFVDTYGKEAAEWLKNLGVREYGFNPPSELEKATEEIYVSSLDIKMKGFSGNPTAAQIKKIKALVDAGGSYYNPIEKLIVAPLNEIRDFRATIQSLPAEKQQSLFDEWISLKLEASRLKKRLLMNKISKTKFMVVVGKAWFAEFKSRDENSLQIVIDGQDIFCSIEDKEIKVKI